MKIIQCSLCKIKTSPFVQTWGEFLDEIEGWTKYFCTGKEKHVLYECPRCKLFECPKCRSIILSEIELNQLNADRYDCDVGSRF